MAEEDPSPEKTDPGPHSDPNTLWFGMSKGTADWLLSRFLWRVLPALAALGASAGGWWVSGYGAPVDPGPPAEAPAEEN